MFNIVLATLPLVVDVVIARFTKLRLRTSSDSSHFFFLTDLMNWIGCNCPDHSRDTPYVAPAPSWCQSLTLLWAKAKKGDGRKCQFREDKYYWRRKNRSRCWSIGFNMCHLLMWWKLHHWNNIYLKWSQCFFFNLNKVLCLDSVAFPRKPRWT